MAIILTTALPGAGHWYAGSRLRGAYYLIHSTILVASVLVCIFQAISRAAAGEGVFRPIAIALVLGAYGLLYTGVAVMDIRGMWAVTGEGNRLMVALLNGELLVVASLLATIVILTT